MNNEQIQKILSTSYFVSLQGKWRAAFVGLADKGEFTKIHRIVACKGLLYDTIGELTKAIDIIEPVQIPLFFKNLKDEVQKPLSDAEDIEYTKFINWYAAEYVKFINLLDVDYYIELRKMSGPRPAVEPITTRLNNIFLDRFQNENSEKERISRELTAIFLPEEKIKFLKIERLKYLKGRPPEVMSASGEVALTGMTGGYFLDGWIDCEIEILELENPQIAPIEGIEMQNTMQYIALLYELGVITYLEETYGLSKNKIATLLSTLSNYKVETLLGYIKNTDGVKNPKNNPFTLKNRRFLDSVYNQLGINPIKRGTTDEERLR